MKSRLKLPFCLLTSGLAIALFACNSEDAAAPEDTNLDTIEGGVVVERTLLPAGIFPWEVDFDTKTMKRNEYLEEAIFSTDSMIVGLNQLYPNVQVKKLRISKDTLYLDIPKSAGLADRMGTNGAGSFMADAVINLTSGSDSIHYVNFSFTGGSHAQPGVYSMQNYKDYKVIR